MFKHEKTFERPGGFCVKVTLEYIDNEPSGFWIPEVYYRYPKGNAWWEAFCSDWPEVKDFPRNRKAQLKRNRFKHFVSDEELQLVIDEAVQKIKPSLDDLFKTI